MTTPEEQLDQTMSAAQDLIDEFSAIAGDAAKKIDAGDYSLDDRVKAAHKMFELAILGGVLWTEAWISLPALWGKLEAQLPEPCDAIDVTPDPTNERTLKIPSFFVKRGDTTVTVLPKFLKFVPTKLAPGAKQFQIALLDPNFSGALYDGKVQLTTATGTTTEIVVAVEL